jgi:hypothetical protein
MIDNTKKGNLEIINSLGQTVMNEIKTDHQKILDLKNLKKGLYFIKLKNQTSKFIIK